VIAAIGTHVLAALEGGGPPHPFAPPPRTTIERTTAETTIARHVVDCESLLPLYAAKMLYRVTVPRAAGTNTLPVEVLKAARTAARESAAGDDGELYTANCHAAVATATAEEIDQGLQSRQSNPGRLFCEGCRCAYSLVPPVTEPQASGA
jgi:hypothetical protein